MYRVALLQESGAPVVISGSALQVPAIGWWSGEKIQATGR